MANDNDWNLNVTIVMELYFDGIFCEYMRKDFIKMWDSEMNLCERVCFSFNFTRVSCEIAVINRLGVFVNNYSFAPKNCYTICE